MLDYALDHRAADGERVPEWIFGEMMKSVKEMEGAKGWHAKALRCYNLPADLFGAEKIATSKTRETFDAQLADAVAGLGDIELCRMLMGRYIGSERVKPASLMRFRTALAVAHIANGDVETARAIYGKWIGNPGLTRSVKRVTKALETRDTREALDVITKHWAKVKGTASASEARELLTSAVRLLYPDQARMRGVIGEMEMQRFWVDPVTLAWAASCAFTRTDDLRDACRGVAGRTPRMVAGDLFRALGINGNLRHLPRWWDEIAVRQMEAPETFGEGFMGTLVGSLQWEYTVDLLRGEEWKERELGGRTGGRWAEMMESVAEGLERRP